jgi:anti-anti-sigma factor
MALAVVPLAVRRAPTDGSTPSATVREEGTGTLVTVCGEVGLSAAPVLAEALSRVILQRCGDVVIDLAGLEFLDSASGRVLTACKRMLDCAGRRLTFRSPSRLAVRVLSVFALSGLIEPRAQGRRSGLRASNWKFPWPGWPFENSTHFLDQQVQDLPPVNIDHVGEG